MPSLGAHLSRGRGPEGHPASSVSLAVGRHSRSVTQATSRHAGQSRARAVFIVCLPDFLSRAPRFPLCLFPPLSLLPSTDVIFPRHTHVTEHPLGAPN